MFRFKDDPVHACNAESTFELRTWTGVKFIVDTTSRLHCTPAFSGPVYSLLAQRNSCCTCICLTRFELFDLLLDCGLNIEALKCASAPFPVCDLALNLSYNSIEFRLRVICNTESRRPLAAFSAGHRVCSGKVVLFDLFFGNLLDIGYVRIDRGCWNCSSRLTLLQLLTEGQASREKTERSSDTNESIEVYPRPDLEGV